MIFVSFCLEAVIEAVVDHHFISIENDGGRKDISEGERRLSLLAKEIIKMESEPLVHLPQDKNSNASLEFCRLVNSYIRGLKYEGL